MPNTQLILQAPSRHLRQLVLLRSGLIIALTCALLVAHNTAFARLPLAPVLATLGFLTVVNALSLLRLKSRYQVQLTELVVQLGTDMLAIAFIAYYTGGATNPFLSYLLVPVCIAAAILPAYYAWPLSLSGILAYGALLIWYQPLYLLAPPSHIHQHTGSSASGPNLHVIGMWLNFALSALLISYFVVRMAEAIRRQQDDLNAHREENLRNEQLLAIATQAAGTAHELGTPLSTMKILLHDLQQQKEIQTLCGEDLALVQQQLDQCANTLAGLRQRADLKQLTHPPRIAVRQYCAQVIERWQLLRPEVRATIQRDDSIGEQKVCLHPTIEQAIINLLNNAADACPENLALTLHCSADYLHWQIMDDGTGIDPDVAAHLGRVPLTTKPDGLGLGLFLTHASIDRYGGKIHLYNREEGGTCTDLALPLEQSDDL